MRWFFFALFFALIEPTFAKPRLSACRNFSRILQKCVLAAARLLPTVVELDPYKGLMGVFPPEIARQLSCHQELPIFPGYLVMTPVEDCSCREVLPKAEAFIVHSDVALQFRRILKNPVREALLEAISRKSDLTFIEFSDVRLVLIGLDHSQLKSDNTEFIYSQTNRSEFLTESNLLHELSRIYLSLDQERKNIIVLNLEGLKANPIVQVVISRMHSEKNVEFYALADVAHHQSFSDIYRDIKPLFID